MAIVETAAFSQSNKHLGSLSTRNLDPWDRLAICGILTPARFAVPPQEGFGQPFERQQKGREDNLPPPDWKSCGNIEILGVQFARRLSPIPCTSARGPSPPSRLSMVGLCKPGTAQKEA